MPSAKAPAPKAIESDPAASAPLLRLVLVSPRKLFVKLPIAIEPVPIALDWLPIAIELYADVDALYPIATGEPSPSSPAITPLEGLSAIA